MKSRESNIHTRIMAEFPRDIATEYRVKFTMKSTIFQLGTIREAH